MEPSGWSLEKVDRLLLTLPGTTPGLQRLVADIMNRVSEDDRYSRAALSEPLQPARSPGEPKPEQPGRTVEGEADRPLESCIRSFAARAVYFCRRGKASKAAKGDQVAMLLETETIPQSLWPAAPPFARWLVAHPEVVCKKRVLELGSGVGFVGFVALELGAASVTLTDCSAVSLALIVAAIEANGYHGRAHAAELRWGDEDAVSALRSRLVSQLAANDDRSDTSTVSGPDFPPPFDVVIGCDIFYFNTSLRSGVRTAAAALRRNGGGAPTDPPAFYCASVVRSERMDIDIDTLPAACGFLSSQEELTQTNLQPAAEASGLRIYRWQLVDEPGGS